VFPSSNKINNERTYTSSPLHAIIACTGATLRVPLLNKISVLNMVAVKSVVWDVTPCSMVPIN
jgi:hypothetical protein